MTFSFELSLTSKEFARILYLMKTSKNYDKDTDENILWKMKLIAEESQKEESENEDSEEED